MASRPVWFGRRQRLEYLNTAACYIYGVTDVCIIGVGNVGGALALVLPKAGYQLSQTVIRSSKDRRRVGRLIPNDAEIITVEPITKIDAEIVFITTRDPEIELVASRISNAVRKGQFVFHTSGSLSSEVLNDLAKKGCEVGSIHPLTAISDPVRGAEQFAGTFFCVEGSQKAARLGRKIVRDLGGKPFMIETELKPLYHAAAVTSAGQITALFDTAVETLSKCGMDRGKAAKILFPLAASTVGNLEFQSPEDALTGPFARLDTKTFESHLKLLRKHLPANFVQLYLLLGELSLDLVERRSGRSPQSRGFRKRISVAKEKSR